MLSPHEALPIFKSDHASHVDAHGLNFLLIFRANIDKDVLQCRRLFLRGITHVNGWPSKQTFHNSFFRVDIDALARRDLMLRSAIAPRSESTRLNSSH